MIVRDLLVEPHPEAVRLSAQFDFDTRPQLSGRVWIEWPPDFAPVLKKRLDPFAVIALPLSGALREPLRGEGPISQKLLRNLHEAAGVYQAYFPKLFRRLPIEIPVEARSPVQGRWASFYSGGVDSLYTVVEIERRAQAGTSHPLDQLWLVHGFDISLEGEELWERVRERLIKSVEGKLPQRVVCIRTNLRSFYDPVFPWARLGFGAAMAGVAKCVAGSVSTVLISSYTTYERLIPHASTPLVDPLWSCEEQEIVHFSCLADRNEKLQTIATRPELLEGLRVCFRNTGGDYNCGACEKCLRTQVELIIAGLQERSHSFPWPLDLRALRAVELPYKREEVYVWQFWLDIYARCRARLDLKALSRAIRSMLIRNRLRCAFWLCFRRMRRSLRRILRRYFRRILRGVARRLGLLRT